MKNISQFTRKYKQFSTSKKQLDVLKDVIKKQIDDIKEAGTYKKERVITSSQNSSISVQNSNKHVLNFCANNYLGLSDHPELIQSAKKTLDSHGLGMSSVRFFFFFIKIHLWYSGYS
jgi:glycine C-acetyltransferase